MYTVPSYIEQLQLVDDERFACIEPYPLFLLFLQALHTLVRYRERRNENKGNYKEEKDVKETDL